MKQYLLLPLLFLAFACSSDEMDDDEIGKTVDPFIGCWYVDSSNDDSIDITIFEVSADGNINEKTLYDRNGILITRFFNSRWENQGDDFSSLNQTYVITSDDGDSETIEITFSDDFNSLSYDFYDDNVKGIRLSEDGINCLEYTPEITCLEKNVVDIINSFKDMDEGSSYNFPFGEYNLLGKFGGSTPIGGTFDGITYSTVGYYSQSDSSIDGIAVYFEYREDTGELIFVFVGELTNGGSQNQSWSNVRRFYAPGYPSDDPSDYETDSLCDLWDKLNSYVESL